MKKKGLIRFIMVVLLSVMLTAAMYKPAMTGSNSFGINLGGGSSAGSPYGDILNKIKRKKELQKQQFPSPPQIPPQQSQPPESSSSPGGIQQSSPPFMDIPLQQERPAKAPVTPAISLPGLTQKEFKGLPPVLQRLFDLGNRVAISMNPLTQCSDIDRGAREIMQELFRIVSSKSDVKIPEGFVLPIRFCKKTEVVWKDWGELRIKDLMPELLYHVEVRSKAAWTATYTIAMGKNGLRGIFNGYFLYVKRPKKGETRGVKVDAKGRVKTISLDGSVFYGPIDRHKILSKGGISVLGPVEVKKPLPQDVSEMIADPEPVTQYGIHFVAPSVLFYNSRDALAGKAGIPASCHRITGEPQIMFSARDLSIAIKRGKLVKILGRGEIVIGEVFKVLPDGSREKVGEMYKKIVIDGLTAQSKGVGDVVAVVYKKLPDGRKEKVGVVFGYGDFHLGESETAPDCLDFTTVIEIELPPLICKTDKNAGSGAIAVAGDCIDHGGYIMPNEDRVFVNGKPVARVGDRVFCLIHGITEIVGDKSNTVSSRNRKIARVGDKTKCGATIMGGSESVFIGNSR